MTVLGEAFIEVRSDLRPFIRDLDREVKRAADNIERQLRGALSRGLGSGSGDGDRLGEDLGDGVSRGLQRKLGVRNQSPWILIASTLASVLDDGISRLPVEVKAALVAGILAALPFISAALAGTVAAALGIGLAGVGTALAFQFQEVEDAGKDMADTLRVQFVEAAQPFVGVLIAAFNVIERRVEELRPRLDRIFDVSSTFVGPLVEGMLDAFDFITESIDRVAGKLEPFIDEFANGFAVIGIAIGDAFEILVNTGEEGEEGLRDILNAVAALIVGTAQLIAFFTEVYGLIRDISEAVPFLVGPLAIFFEASDNAAFGAEKYGEETEQLTRSILGTRKATDDQNKSLKETAAAMDKARDAVFGLIDATLDYEQSIDDLSETLKDNGKTFTQETEKGRENIRAVGDAIKAAQRDAEDRFAQGKLTAAEANALYQQEVDEILKIARAHGVSENAIRGVYDEALKMVNLPQPDTGWLTNITSAANLTAAALARALAEARKLLAAGVGPRGKGRGGNLEFGEGGIVHTPTQATIGDQGAEAIVPLTKPARAAQIMRQSGLDKMLGGGGTTVYVYIGNEQLDSRTTRIVEANNQALGNSLAFGARGL